MSHDEICEPWRISPGETFDYCDKLRAIKVRNENQPLLFELGFQLPLDCGELALRRNNMPPIDH